MGKKDKSERINHFWFRVKWVIRSVLECGVDRVTDDKVAQLWCQYTFLMGMNGEDRNYTLDNWTAGEQFKELSYLEEYSKEFVRPKSSKFGGRQSKGFEIKPEPEEYVGCEANNFLYDLHMEQYDEGEPLSTARKKSCANVKVAKKRNRDKYPKKAIVRPTLETANSNTIVDHLIVIKEEFPQDLAANSDMIGEKIEVKLEENENKVPDDTWPCSICLEPFKNREELQAHNKQMHEDAPVSCHICNKEFSTYQKFGNLRNHMLVHERQKQRNRRDHSPMKCSICNEIFYNKDMLHTHTKEMHRDVPVSCHLCNKQFTSYQKLGKLRHHIKVVHEAPPKPKVETSEDTTQICICCGKIFPNKYRLNLHRRQNGGKYHNNKCPKCPDVEFKSWPENQDHMRALHDGEVFIRCKQCPEYFGNRQSRIDHVRQKHQEREVQCSDCGKVFKKGAYKYHHRMLCQKASDVKGNESQAKTEFECKDCDSGETFPNRSELRKHFRKEHAKFFPCVLCGVKLRKEHQKIHDLIHHTPEDKKPYVCPQCVPLKGFATKQYFDEHMNIHLGLKPYSCKLCQNAAYSNKSNLLAHTRQVHQGRKRKANTLK